MQMRKKTWKRKEIVILPPSYIRAPGSTHTISLVVIHKGVEVVIVRVGSSISVASFRLGKRVNWTVIDHMSQDVTSSTDPKIAYLVRMSPLMTEITLGRQTMMCGMTWCHFPTIRTGVQGAGEPMVTKTQATVTLGGRGIGVRILDEDSRDGRCDPLPICNLDVDGFIVSYRGGSR